MKTKQLETLRQTIIRDHELLAAAADLLEAHGERLNATLLRQYLHHAAWLRGEAHETQQRRGHDLPAQK